MGEVDLRVGDCLELLPTLAAESVDAVVTDPPYGLSFMGKDWDHGIPGPHFWREALRVAKPGAHLLAFGGTRTFHRLACAIEDAGWEIRDTLSWLYGQGFPKSLDVSKAIDKAAGAERQIVGKDSRPAYESAYAKWDKPYEKRSKNFGQGEWDLTAAATDAARRWSGWGTALKPAWEPIILARKPLSGTVAGNVQKHGTGAINVEGCRIGTTGRPHIESKNEASVSAFGDGLNGSRLIGQTNLGRWPANVLLDEEAAAMLDEQSGDEMHGAGSARAGRFGGDYRATSYDLGGPREMGRFGDSGGASRFFYTAKSSSDDRSRGLDGIEIVMVSLPTWEDEDRKARLWVDTAQSPPKVIAVFGTHGSDATEWNTFLFGKPTTGRSLAGIRFTIETENPSTTGSRTLRSFRRWHTSASIRAVSGEALSGGNPVADAERSGPSLTITFDETGFLPGAGHVPSGTQFVLRGNAGNAASHPTVKPTDLMRWLCRLITPPGGLILDPFCGSGSTGVAALAEGFRFLGIEKEAEYVEIARRRIGNVAPLFNEEGSWAK